MDLEQRYRNLEAKLNYLSVKKDAYLEAEKLLKRELASIQDETDEITKELLSVMDQLRKS